MDKRELVSRLQTKTGLSKTDIQRLIDSFGDILEEELLEDEHLPPEKREVRFPPWGKFSLRVIEPKTRNIAGQETDVPKQYKINFRPFKAATKKLE